MHEEPNIFTTHRLISMHGFSPDGIVHSFKKSGEHLHTILLIGVPVFAIEFLTLALLSKMLVAYILAFFQLGLLIQVFLGYRIFQEEHF